jgi:hypothetical protein
MNILQMISTHLQNRVSIDARLTELIELNIHVETLGRSERVKLDELLNSFLKEKENESK